MVEIIINICIIIFTNSVNNNINKSKYLLNTNGYTYSPHGLLNGESEYDGNTFHDKYIVSSQHHMLSYISYGTYIYGVDTQQHNVINIYV